ncbi:MAG: hypothetical protein IIT72_03775 [Lachnospiraceae bacterium]|nr:hypothetical protein [Lachnospiraceae bacterium]MBQ2577527.1 hypothetical protein [Lachnospiraceae bacterium]MBQ5484585.1 hypothetical protein [Lachnospiraceae bacterium]MCR4733266.1 hypothetical protein [Lachnospiraceae bacterium]MEE3355612.1 hypothetical protein [Candidatus Weimeria sp.]
MHIFESTKTTNTVKFKKGSKFDLIDRAAKGEVEAAGLLAEGYAKGTYDCERNDIKAMKWAKYAAGKGDPVGIRVLEELKK